MLPYGNGIRNFEEIILAMQFASIYFIIFFSALLVGYYAMPAKKYQYLFILGCNLIFYISWMNSIWDLFMLGILIVITWGGGIFSRTAPEQHGIKGNASFRTAAWAGAAAFI